MNIDVKLVRAEYVNGRRRLSVHYTYWRGCKCGMKRKHFYVYTDDEGFDIIQYIKDNHRDHGISLLNKQQYGT